MAKWLAAGLAGLAALPVLARDISFEDRVRYQRAMEEVYWSHRIWPAENPTPKPPLSAVMTDEAIRARVEDYLKKSSALEAVWQRPVNGEQLQAELDRMVRDTRSPTTLKDLFDALGGDPFVIAETLGRQTLVDRLARDWYASDARFHGATKRRAEAARAGCRTVAQMRASGGEYREVTYVRERDDASLPSDGALRLDAAEWEDHRATLDRRLPGAGSRVGRISELEETDDGFSMIGVLSDDANETKLAVVTWPKTPFDTWWSRERAELSAAAGATSGPYELASPSAATCAEDTWGQPMPDHPLRSRAWHAGVWTGAEMMIWGGTPVAYVDGARYNPATDTWNILPKYRVPSSSLAHTAVWTGTEMIVWGGLSSGTPEVPGPTLNTGGRYNPTTQTWTPTSTGAGVPTPRQGHTAVWTGSVMVVWGGYGIGWLEGAGATGAMYDPSSDSWTITSSAGAPEARFHHTAVWTGSQMIVWGGTGNPTIAPNDGARFDPTSNTWTSLSVVGAPSARYLHTAVWDGNGMIVWGGYDNVSVTNTGGRYVPATDTWTATSTTADVATARFRHSAVWTGTRMIVWGGQVSVDANGLNTGSSYDPVTQTWTLVPTLNAPSVRYAMTTLWTGTEMIVWGGRTNPSPNTVLGTGGRYDPASGTWVPTRSTQTGPSGQRFDHAALWTGSEMLVWGGFPPLTVCGRYAPATDSWTSAVAPQNFGFSRQGPAAVWTGTEMIAWGGALPQGHTGVSGVRFNPTTNTWSIVAEDNKPSVRIDHTAIWTGTRMIVWGGKDPNTQVALRDGGRYNPGFNSWMATLLPDAPSERSSHTAVWTGSTMVVWGGTPDGSSGLNTGGRYDPASNSWTATSLGPGVPSPRFGHETVWTGTRMTVWGGGGAGVGSTGALYDPVANAWSPMSTGVNAPSERRWAATVWTGTEMFVWGGLTATDAPLNTGGRYNPVSDTWAPMSTGANVPLARYKHTAVWTGREIVVYGGNDNVSLETDSSAAGMAAGALYCVNGCAQPATFYRDADGDGFGTASLPAPACVLPAGYSASSTDCNDGNPSVNPGATETCNGVDLNCDGVGDTQIPPEIGFGTIERLGPTSARYPWSTVPGTRYDAYRGVYAGAVGTDPLNEFCLGNDTTSTFWDDTSIPDPGALWWFLVRSVNSCGDGTLGFQTVHAMPTTERISLPCP